MKRVNPYILTTLKHRFDEQVSEADILSWLYNFDEQDWEAALTLLNQVTFYSEHTMATKLECGMRIIIAEQPQNKILICPIGGIGKSGGVIAYIVKKLMGRFSKVSWNFYDESTELKNEPYKVVLLDEFVGTGESALELYEMLKARYQKVVNTVAYAWLAWRGEQRGYKMKELR